eukprot:404589_1
MGVKVGYNRKSGNWCKRFFDNRSLAQVVAAVVSLSVIYLVLLKTSTETPPEIPEPSVDKAEAEKFAQFSSWLKSGGAKLDKIEFRAKSADDRNTYVTQFIGENEEIVFIPQSRLLTTRQAIGHPLGRKSSPKPSRLPTRVCRSS